MSDEKASVVSARAMLSVVRTMTQIIRSWLVITLQRNTRVVLLVLKPLCLQVKLKSAGHIPMYRKQLMRFRAAVYLTSNKCNVI